MGTRTAVGVAWRPPLAGLIDGLARSGELTFTEIVAENLDDPTALPAGLIALRDMGVTVVPHGVTLGLAGAELPRPDLLGRLAALAERLQAPLVSEHVAFVRAGGHRSGPH